MSAILQANDLERPEAEPTAALSDPAPPPASARTKNGQSSRADGRSMGPNALDHENRDAQICVQSHQISRAADSPWWMGLPALAGAPRLPWSVALRHSPLQLPRQAGRSDLCSQHQRGNAGHCGCFVIRVTQRCWISHVCHKMARDSRLVALAAAHALRLTADAHRVDTVGVRSLCCVVSPLADREKRGPNVPCQNGERGRGGGKIDPCPCGRYASRTYATQIV